MSRSTTALLVPVAFGCWALARLIESGQLSSPATISGLVAGAALGLAALVVGRRPAVRARLGLDATEPAAPCVR